MLMLRTCLAFLLALGQASLTQAQVSVLQPLRPVIQAQGIVLDAAFGSNHVFVQTEDAPAIISVNSGITSARHLSVYGIKEGSWLLSVPISGGEAAECGAVKLDFSSSSLAVCTGNQEIQIRDANDLHLKKTLKISSGVRLNDITISTSQGVIYTAGVNQIGSIILGSYSLSSGKLLNESEASKGFQYPSVSLAIAESGHWLAMTVKDPGNRKARGAVIACRIDVPTPVCKTIPQREFVAASGFLYDSTLLFVSSVLAGSHDSECVQSLKLSTFSIDQRAFCSKDGPAHYAMAVLGRDKVVAFTGYAKRNGFTENTTPMTSNASVWSVEPKRVIAIAEDKTGGRALQTEEWLVTDPQQENRFMMFRRFGTTISVYQLPNVNEGN